MKDDFSKTPGGVRPYLSRDEDLADGVDTRSWRPLNLLRPIPSFTTSDGIARHGENNTKAPATSPLPRPKGKPD